MDQVLPFGLRSAALIFLAVADALLWIVLKRGVSWVIHYIDDFLTIGRPQSEEAYENMQLMQKICERAGLLIKPSKSMGPLTCITFLGIEIDLVKGELQLPRDKLRELKQTLSQWQGMKACRCNTIPVAVWAQIYPLLRLLLYGSPQCGHKKVDKLDDIKNFQFKKGQ